MSSFSRALGAALLAVVVVVPLAGCSGLRPVYSDAGLGAQRVEVSYADPRNRLEQIIYQDLALRLGKVDGAVPEVKISVSQDGKDLVVDTFDRPVEQRRVTVTAKLTVTSPDGEVLFSGSRAQTADYTTDRQALANQQTRDSAARQAALLLSDTLRLQIIAALSK